MGRELQKRKRRSGKPKVTRKPKSKKQILQNPIIAANWDSKQTLSQSYARLGLTTRLNKKSGGSERYSVSTQDGQAMPSLAVHPSGRRPGRTAESRDADPEHAHTADTVSLMPEVQVERDPETGAILRVIEAKVTQKETAPKHLTAAEQAFSSSGRKPLDGATPSLNSLADNDDDSDDGEFNGFPDVHASDGFIGSAALSDASNPLLRQLSDAALSAQAQPKAKRKQSERERDWCARMIAKHGDDVSAMFKDRDMNVLQLSEGALRKKVKAFRQRVSV